MLRKLVAILLALFLPLVSGCWDVRDLEELSFPVAFAYDLHQPGSADATDPPASPGEKVFDLTTVVPNLVSDAIDPVNVEALSGFTIADSRQRKSLTDGNEYVTGMNRTLIIGEDLARQGLNSYINVLWRGASITGTMYMAVAEGRGEEILKTPVRNYKNIGTYLISLFAGINERTFIPVTDLLQFYINQSTGKNPVMPVLKRQGDQVVITGAAIFRKDRMITRVGIEDAHNLVLLRGMQGRSYLPFTVQIEDAHHRGTVLVTNSRKVKYSRSDQGHVFNITIMLEGTLEELSHHALTDEKDLTGIEKAIERQVASQCERFIDKMKNDIKVDCIDISKYALARERKSLAKIVDTPAFIRDADIKIKVKVHLQNTGEVR
jgi:Ger(x)C family germination protein